METCIVYYSRSNNTRTGAKYLSKRIEARLVELVEKKGRKGLKGFLKSGFQAATQKESKLLGDPLREIGSCTSLLLMTPIWASHSTPAMNAFLKNADLEGREIRVITFQAGEKGEGSEKVYTYIKDLVESRGGLFVKGIPLHSAPPGKFAGEEYIERQIEDILDAL